MSIDRRFSVAPMMACTDRHNRYLHRLLSKHALLYSEMVTTDALIHGDRKRLLDHHPEEHPVALQLAGNVPNDMALCASLVEQAGFDEININVGCPSDRVQAGCFGAALMAYPEIVARCVAAIVSVTTLPITVKTRIGIDDLDSYEALCRFIQTISDAGCRTFIVHARKAWLKGLSPKENREIPPLRYDVVANLTRDFPHLQFVLNGGIETLDHAKQHLRQFSGIMMGRAIYHNPYILATVDNDIFSCEGETISRDVVLDAYCDYGEEAMRSGTPLRILAKHVLGLFHATPGTRQWRRYISERWHLHDSVNLLREARESTLV